MRRKTHSLNTAGRAMVLCAAMTLIAGAVHAQVCEYPLPIMRHVPDGNVIFLLDSSGSMNEIVYHNDFDRDVVWAGDMDPTALYTVKQDGMFAPSDFESTAPDTPVLYLVNSDNSMDGLYLGNYLNWLYFHATDAQRASMPLMTRIQTAKAVLSDLVWEHDNIRFGVEILHPSGSGGTYIAKVGSPRADLLNQVQGVSARGSTPLAEAMLDIKTVFEDDGQYRPILYDCQKSFIVMLTDGFPTSDLDVPAYVGDWDNDGREPGDCASIGAPRPNSDDCSDWVDDVAGYMFEYDHRPDLDGVQNLVTYVVGYYIDAPLLRDTARNGDGLFFPAMNVAELHQALRNVLRDIVRRISAGSAVAVVSTEDQTDDRLFRAKYLPGKWQGFLEAFALPYTPGDSPVWEAGALLNQKSPDSRNIFTSVQGVQMPLTVGNATDLWDDMQVADENVARAVIAWTRGNNIAGLRDREGWLLGDVVDSSPLIVGAPATFAFDPDYRLFRDANENRRHMLYFGANDCGLHALDLDSGEEQWMYVPETQLWRLKNLASEFYCHEYSVNLTPRATDVKINGIYHTVLIGGMKHGGDAYFAIDVTDPDTPRFMWETTIPKLNGSWAWPVVTRVSWHNNPVAIVGSGPDFTGGISSYHILDMADGTLLYSEPVSTRLADVNMTTSATVVDLDFDQMGDVFYMGDLIGNMWRVDITTFPPTRTLLFAGNQPVQAKPILTIDYNDDVYVYFGTGQYLAPEDFDTAQPQTMYCVIDNHSLYTATRSDLVNQTSVIAPLDNADRGWYIDLENGPGERITEQAALVAGVVYATAFEPTTELCGFGGHSWLYKMNFRNGGAADGDDDASNDTADNRTEDLGDGIASRPVVDVVNEKLIVQGSDTEIHVYDTVGTVQLLVIRSWRQRYN